MSFMRERAVDTLTTETMRRRHLRRVLDHFDYAVTNKNATDTFH